MLIISLIFCFAGGQVTAQNEALEYLEQISREYEQVVKAQWNYAQSAVEGLDYSREKQKLITAMDRAIQRIKAIPPFSRDHSLRDSVLAYLNLNRKMIREDYTQLVDLQNLENKSYEELDDFLYAQENAYERLGELSVNLRKEEEKFAKKHGIRLVKRDDKFARRLLEMNQLFSYYNKVYSQFYKAYSQELVVFKAVEEQEPEGIRRELERLREVSENGLEEIRKIGGYKGNRGLYEASLNSLNFYKREVDELQPVLDYYQQLEKMEKMRKERREGKGDTEEYNQVVREINNTGENLNNINEALNRERVILLDEWNTISGSFLSEQLP